MNKQKLILGPAQLEPSGRYIRPIVSSYGYDSVSVWEYEDGWHNMYIEYFPTREEAMRAAEESLKQWYDITIVEDQEQFDRLQLLI